MDNWMYVMFIERGKNYNKMTKEVVDRHVDNLRRLDEAGKIELSGIFKGYPGVAGMFIIKTDTEEEAVEICRSEPLVAEGYAKYKLHKFHIANKENNYLL